MHVLSQGADSASTVDLLLGLHSGSFHLPDPWAPCGYRPQRARVVGRLLWTPPRLPLPEASVLGLPSPSLASAWPVNSSSLHLFPPHLPPTSRQPWFPLPVALQKDL